MATIKLFLDKRRVNKKGLYPLKFRVHHHNKYGEINTGYSLEPNAFDEKREKITRNKLWDDEVQQKRNLMEIRLTNIPSGELKTMSVVTLIDTLQRKATTEYTIADFWEEEIQRLITCNRSGGAEVYAMSFAAVSKELNLHIPFAQLTTRTILQLESKLSQRGLKINSIGVHMRTFKAICNKAIKQDLVDFSWYPFRKYTIRREKTVPRVLSLQELKSYFNLNIPPSHPLYRSWCIGKLLFYCRGMNIRDALKLNADNIKAGRIIYRRSKTGKMYSIAITPAMEEVLTTFTTNGTLLGVMKPSELVNGDISIKRFHQCSKVINHHLEKLGEMIQSQEVITTYVFRYTYANIAKQLGYSKDLIAEALGHEYGNAVTGIYLEMFDNDIVDKMNEQVLNAVNKKRED
jgi:site-specific recombinase XerD